MDYSGLSVTQLFATCSSGGGAGYWEEFLRRFTPVIARSVLRVAKRYGNVDGSLVDDLVQETYLKICSNDCRLLRSFAPQQPDSAFAFLKVVSANVAQDHFKARLAQKRAPEEIARSADEALAAPSQAGATPKLDDADRRILIDQIDQTLKAVIDPKELKRARTVFWLYYRMGFSASAIAALPASDLTTKGVESLLLRLTRLVREKVSPSKGGKKVQNHEGIQQAESF